jgi:hypothetical protein
MVQRKIKIPKHGGPDGQGLPEEVFEKLFAVIDDTNLSDIEIKSAIELCLSISTQEQWNGEYRARLLEKIK